MGHIITKIYWPDVAVPQFRDEKERNAYSRAWREVLAHPDVGLLRPDVVEGTDVLISEGPIRVPASSAYAVVAYLTWSKFNGDFTRKSREMFTGETEEEIMEKIGVFQRRIRPMIALHITQTYFPNLSGVKYGVNLWPMQQAYSTFVAA